MRCTISLRRFVAAAMFALITPLLGAAAPG
jgi:hypothetical protein